MEKLILNPILTSDTLDTTASNLTKFINDSTLKFKKEDEFFCFNMRQLANHLESIKNKLSKLNENYIIQIFYFKRLYKTRTIIRLFINEYRYSIIYEFLSVSLNIKKMERRDLLGNLIEEILEKFQPLLELKLYSDNLNPSGNYTAKHLVNDCKVLKNLELNNFIFPINLIENKENKNVFPYQPNENLIYFKNFLRLNKNEKIENLSLNFQFNETNSGYNFLKNFYFILENLFNKNIKNVNFRIYHDDYIDLSELNNPKLMNDYFSNNGNNFINIPYEMNELKFHFINTNLSSKRVLTREDIVLLTTNLMYKFSPEFLELNFVEIMSSENSKLDKTISIYKFTKIIYSKKFFSIINSIKNKFSGKNSKNLNYKNNKNILEKIIKFLNLNLEDIFEIKTNHLQLMINNNKKLNSTKFLFNLTQDYESVLKRRIKYEDILQMIINKPKDEDNFNSITNYIKLNKYDLNSISKILSKIEGNNLVFINDGRQISIGGKFKKIINNIEYSLGLNSVLEISKDYSKMRIITFKDNYFMSHFHSAAEILDHENILIVGGISTQELLPNFAKTPIYKLNTNNFEITKLFLDESSNFYPGVIFNHKIKIWDQFFIEISEGFVIENYSGGLNILNSKFTKPKVEPNNDTYIYDLNKNVWDRKIPVEESNIII